MSNTNGFETFELTDMSEFDDCRNSDNTIHFNESTSRNHNSSDSSYIMSQMYIHGGIDMTNRHMTVDLPYDVSPMHTVFESDEESMEGIQFVNFGRITMGEGNGHHDMRPLDDDLTTGIVAPKKLANKVKPDEALSIRNGDVQTYAGIAFIPDLSSTIVNHRTSKLLEFHALLNHSLNKRDNGIMRSYVDYYFDPDAHYAFAKSPDDVSEENCLVINRNGFLQYVDFYVRSLSKRLGYISVNNEKTVLLPEANCRVVIVRNKMKSVQTAREYFNFITGEKFSFELKKVQSFLDVLSMKDISSEERDLISRFEESTDFLDQKFIINDYCYGRLVISEDRKCVLSYTMSHKLKSFHVYKEPVKPIHLSSMKRKRAIG